MPKISAEAFENLVVNKPDNFIIIFFNPGMGGSSLLRILIAHKELYHSFKNLGQGDYDDPIRYPDSWEGFSYQFPHPLTMKEQHLGCAHVSFHTPWDYTKKEGQKITEDFREYFSLVAQGETIVLKTHRFDLYNKFKKSRCIFVVQNTPLERNINLYERYSADNSEPVLDAFHSGNPSFLPPDVLKVDTNKLMSKDYDTFLSEYMKLVLEFGLTPRVNSVRAFILLWLEKQKRMLL